MIHQARECHPKLKQSLTRTVQKVQYKCIRPSCVLTTKAYSPKYTVGRGERYSLTCVPSIGAPDCTGYDTFTMKEDILPVYITPLLASIWTPLDSSSSHTEARPLMAASAKGVFPYCEELMRKETCILTSNIPTQCPEPGIARYTHQAKECQPKPKQSPKRAVQKLYHKCNAWSHHPAC